MAWSMPSTGQWNPGIGMTATGMTPDMNMGSYTPEQWALMQQQNWQQWSQWQQQYAQWQSQYGTEYAQQMQSMQAMSGVQPGAAGAMPPPVPPPEKPPPPPPHENDQPLYGSSAAKAIPGASSVKTQLNTQVGYNGNTTTGNKNWSYTADPQPEKQSSQGVNTEALRMLAEEEKLFDIQFQKWEEEIEKWKQENVNHPDRQAYTEYEQKFEACRAQLLERRRQMKIKRDKLMGNTLPASSTPQTGNNTKVNSTPTPTNKTVTNYTPNMQSNVQKNVQNKNTNVQSYSNKQPNQYQQYSNTAQRGYNKNDNNKSVDPQDRYDSYQNLDAEYNSAPPVSSTFIPSSKTSKDIPGLDLVPESDKLNQQPNTGDIIDITEDTPKQHPATPDYSKISKGISSILGDEKIMNILSMVTNQKPPTVEAAKQGGPYQQGGQYQQGGPYQQNRPYQQGGPNQQGGTYQQGGPNQQGGPYQQGGPNQQGGPYQQGGPNQQGGPYQQGGPNQQGGPYQQGGPNQQGGQYQQGGPNQHGGNMMQPNQWDSKNSNYYNNQQQNMPPRQQNMNNYQNPQQQQNSNKLPDTAYQNQRFGGDYDNTNINKQGGPPGQFDERQNQFGNANMPSRGIPPPFRSDIPPPRSLLQNYSPPSPSDYPQGFDTRERNQPVPLNQPVKHKWVDEPLFTPSIIVEYEHKPLRLKARDFIVPAHTFDYNHKSKDGDNNSKRDFEKEVDELFSRKPRNVDRDDWSSERLYSRDHDRPSARDERSRMANRDDYDSYDRKDDRRFDDRDRFRRQDYERRDRGGDSDRLRETGYNRDRAMGRDRDFDRERDNNRDLDGDFRRDRDLGRDRDVATGRGRDFGRDRDIRDRDFGRDRNSGRDPVRDRQDRRDASWNRSRSRERDSRKREHSKDTDSIDSSKKIKDVKDDSSNVKKHVVMIDDLLESPGRDIRPAKIVIILRGPPGSGKSYLAKLIRDKEAEHGVTARIMSIDDYFVHEGEIEEKDPNTGKIIKKPSLKYEYDEKLEESYINSLKRAFKRSLTDGYFSFLIYDAINESLKSYADIWNYARQNGFQVYICTMELDAQTCYKRNIHNRSLEDIQVIASRFFPTPAHHIQLDATTLLQSDSIREVQMEDADDVTMEDSDVVEVDSSFTSKWEKMDDAAQLARLDGTNKPLRPSQLSMEDYLQLDDWKPNVAKPGKKTVRWADLEERREQEKMRAIGFVVGQTDWNRMTDPTMGSSALTQTKYIERVRRS